MKQFLINYKVPLLALLCLLIYSTIQFCEGYYLNPAFGMMLFGFLVSFILMMTLAILTFMLVVTPFMKLTIKDYRNIQTVKQVFAMIIVCMIIVFVVPSQEDGVKNRLGAYTEQDYQEISNIINSANEKYADEGETFSFDVYDKDIINDVKNQHSIFNISSFPIDVMRYKTYITLEWGSGLTGGYELVIFESDNKPKWLTNDRATYLYDNVAFFYKK